MIFFFPIQKRKSTSLFLSLLRFCFTALSLRHPRRRRRCTSRTTTLPRNLHLPSVLRDKPPVGDPLPLDRKVVAVLVEPRRPEPRRGKALLHDVGPPVLVAERRSGLARVERHPGAPDVLVRVRRRGPAHQGVDPLLFRLKLDAPAGSLSEPSRRVCLGHALLRRGPRGGVDYDLSNFLFVLFLFRGKRKERERCSAGEQKEREEFRGGRGRRRKKKKGRKRATMMALWKKKKGKKTSSKFGLFETTQSAWTCSLCDSACSALTREETKSRTSDDSTIVNQEKKKRGKNDAI